MKEAISNSRISSSRPLSSDLGLFLFPTHTNDWIEEMALDLNMTFPKTRLFQLAEKFRDLIFPPICANCRQAGTLICADCYQQIQWIKKPICAGCGQMLGSNTNQKLCKTCQAHPLPLKQICAATIFAEPISTIIHKMKYEGAFGLASNLADLMVSAWSEWETPVDLVVPIPLHPARQKNRGYNQSALIAQYFSKQLGYKFAPDVLKRARFTVPQVGLNAEDRLKNVQNAFAAENCEISKMRILLIDDVCTTGATLASAAETLLEAGASAVSGYCLARAI
jgi:ComF family protein